MRKLVVVMVLVARAGLAADAPAGPDAAKLRRAIAAGWWPSGVDVQLESGRTARDGSIGGAARDAVSSALPRVSAAPGNPSATVEASRSHAAAATPADPAALAQVQTLDSGIRQLSTAAIELDHAGGDYLRMVLAKGGRELMRPFLLFLVERGVLRADEVEGFLDAEPEELLTRLRDRIAATHDKQAGLEVQRYLLMQTLEARKR